MDNPADDKQDVLRFIEIERIASVCLFVQKIVVKIQHHQGDDKPGQQVNKIQALS